MLCNICNKNEATIFFKGVFNKQMLKINLCEECGRKKGVEIKPGFALEEFISNFSAFNAPAPCHKDLKSKKSLICPGCGITYSEFRQSGKLGCSNCYSAFSTYMTPLLEKIHGTSRYTGKKYKPSRQFEEHDYLKIKYSQLKKELENSLKKEQYEQAAQLRDKIRDIKKKLKTA